MLAARFVRVLSEGIPNVQHCQPILRDAQQESDTARRSNHLCPYAASDGVAQPFKHLNSLCALLCASSDLHIPRTLRALNNPRFRRGKAFCKPRHCVVDVSHPLRYSISGERRISS
jgi:hypothetical protein